MRPQQPPRWRLRTLVAGLSLTALCTVVADVGRPASSPILLAARSTRAPDVGSLRVVSYFPSAHWGPSMWMAWDPSVVAADLDRAVWLGIDTIRTFAPTDGCYPTLCDASRYRLASFLAMARARGLRTYLTLYGWSHLPSVTDAKTFVRSVLAPYSGRGDVLAAVELYNEIDQVWTNAQWASWAQELLGYTRAVAGGLPVTISVSDSGRPNARFRTLVDALRGSPPDFYDYHYYGPPDAAYGVFAQARQIAAGVPVAVGEVGAEPRCFAAVNGGCSGVAQQLVCAGSPPAARYLSDPVQELQQADYLRQVEGASRAAGLGNAGIWMLDDELQQCDLLPFGQFYGLFHSDGTAKPAAYAVRQIFAAAVVSSSPSPPPSAAAALDRGVASVAGSNRPRSSGLPFASVSAGDGASAAGMPNNVLSVLILGLHRVNGVAAAVAR